MLVLCLAAIVIQLDLRCFHTSQAHTLLTQDRSTETRDYVALWLVTFYPFLFVITFLFFLSHSLLPIHTSPNKPLSKCHLRTTPPQQQQRQPCTPTTPTLPAVPLHPPTATTGTRSKKLSVRLRLGTFHSLYRVNSPFRLRQNKWTNNANSTSMNH